MKKDDEKDDWGTPGSGTEGEQTEDTNTEAREKAKVNVEAKDKPNPKPKAKAKPKAKKEPEPDPKPRNTMPAANSTRSALSMKKAIKSLTERYNKIVFRDDETATLEVKAQLDALTWALNSALSDSPWLKF